jgi:hypothetical protein
MTIAWRLMKLSGTPYQSATSRSIEQKGEW